MADSPKFSPRAVINQLEEQLHDAIVYPEDALLRKGVVGTRHPPADLLMRPIHLNPMLLGLAPPQAIAPPSTPDRKESPRKAAKKPSKVSKKKKKKKEQEQDGKPKRPLSAYNLFFRDERERMIRDTRTPPNAPRHGIGFANMARVIAGRWNNLNSDTKAWYEMAAEEERKIYYRAVGEWKRKLKEQDPDDANNDSPKKQDTNDANKDSPKNTTTKPQPTSTKRPEDFVPESMLDVMDHLKGSLDDEFMDFMTNLDFNSA